MIPVIAPRPLVLPPPSPVGLVIALSPPAKVSHNHIAGVGSGSQGSYPDLNAFFWYVPGPAGWDPRDFRRRTLVMRGLEDPDGRRAM